MTTHTPTDRPVHVPDAETDPVGQQLEPPERTQRGDGRLWSGSGSFNGGGFCRYRAYTCNTRPLRNPPTRHNANRPSA